MGILLSALWLYVHSIDLPIYFNIDKQKNQVVGRKKQVYYTY